MDEVGVERAPPVAAGLLREVREDRRAGPDNAGIDRAIGILDEVVAGDAFVVRFVSLIGQVGDMQIGDHNGVQVLGLQVLDHLVEMRKLCQDQQ